MDTPNPILPPDSFLLPHNQRRARVRLVVFLVLGVHALGLLAMLMQGCKQPVTAQAEQAETNQVPRFETPTNLPVVPPPTATAVVQTPASPSTPAPVSPSPVPAPPTVPGTDYKVAKGDTFGKIARQFHISTKALIAANPGVSPTRLRIGQSIRIPAAANASANTLALVKSAQ